MPNVETRAAASSIARGRPSRRRQTFADQIVVGRSERDAAIGLPRACAEQVCRGVERQRRQPEQRLARDVHPLAARYEHADPRAALEDHLDGGGGFVDDVLAGVEDKQHRARRQCIGQRRDRIRFPVDRRMNRRRDAGRHERPIRQGGKVDEGDRVGALHALLRDGKRDARLADAAGAGHCDEARGVEKREDMCDVTLAADKRRRWHRQHGRRWLRGRATALAGRGCFE